MYHSGQTSVSKEIIDQKGKRQSSAKYCQFLWPTDDEGNLFKENEIILKIFM